MRKGQRQLIEKARKNGYSEGYISILSREDLTIRQLESVYNELWEFKNKDREWAELFLSISDPEIRKFLIKYAGSSYYHRKEYRLHCDDISYELLKRLSTKQGVCDYFSRDGIICSSILDAEVLIRIGYIGPAPEILMLSRKCSEYENKWRLFQVVDALKDVAEKMPDCCDFFKSIDSGEIMLSNENYIRDKALEWLKTKLPFSLKNADNIPQSVRNIDFHGYQGEVFVNGFHRKVTVSLTSTTIEYCPFDKVYFNKNGNVATAKQWKKSKKLIFFHNSKKFISAYKVKDSWKYKPVQLRDIFSVISIFGTEADEEDALNVVNYLCEKYDTFIFKDLYNDFLRSGGLLLPILVSQAANYHTKAEMFREFYHMPLNGNWNKKNANLTYLVLKLHKRMAPEAIARAMQCSNVSKLRNIGKRRYIMAQILYEAVYGRIYKGSNEESLILDALREEYEIRKIKLNPINQTINEHNARQGTPKNQKVKVKIKENTKFTSLIKNMPSEFELIDTEERLINESDMQHNCVADYADDINNDVCMIYSTVYENERHTIEIREENNMYLVRQCLRACNCRPNPKLTSILADIVKTINAKK